MSKTWKIVAALLIAASVVFGEGVDPKNFAPAAFDSAASGCFSR